MKRFLTAALAALLLFSLPACGGTPADAVPETPDANTQPRSRRRLRNPRRRNWPPGRWRTCLPP